MGRSPFSALLPLILKLPSTPCWCFSHWKIIGLKHKTIFNHLCHPEWFLMLLFQIPFKWWKNWEPFKLVNYSYGPLCSPAVYFAYCMNQQATFFWLQRHWVDQATWVWWGFFIIWNFFPFWRIHEFPLSCFGLATAAKNQPNFFSYQDGWSHCED